MEQCMRNGCNHRATHEVVLYLRNHPNHSPAVAHMGLLVCDTHVDVEWKDVVDAKGWQQIADSFAEQGYARPSQKHSYLKIEPIRAKDYER